MTSEVLDDHALICTDCLMLHANGDLSGYEFHGGDAAELERKVAARLSGYRLTVGWGREQHDCKTNFKVSLTRDGATTSTSVFADDATDAISEACLSFTDLVGDVITVECTELQTVPDLGGECDCETYTFRESYCDSCGHYIAGTYHAATLWKETL